MGFNKHFVLNGSTEYEECLKDAKKYEDIEEKPKQLETKVRYFLSLLDPLKISTQPLSIKVPRNNYEIDVLAEFEDVFVAIECKSGFSNDVSSHIDKITANKGDVQARLRKLSSNDKPCLFLIVYSENEVTPSNFQKAKSDKIDIWNEKIFSEYFMIAKKLKSSGKAIIISDLLAQKNIKWGHKNRRYNCLVTKGTYKDKYDCFSFQMSPEELLKIAYVHRRNFLNSLDKDNTTVTYQRMINTTKIKNIQKYLQIPGNSFPTPILINFEKELTFSEIPERNAEKRTGNVTPGWLTFPEEFGYAWIIDGQHRLFGYSGLKEKSETDMLNVIAFSQLDQVEQANLFVDINQNQKRIPPDYLWDLYTDIYPEDNTLYQISWLVKELNNKSVFFKDRIYIPSISTRESKSYSLKINNIGVSMKNKISNVYKKTLQEDLDRYYEVLDIFFSEIIKNDSLHEDWEKGDEGFICSNNGVGVLCYLLNYFYSYLRFGLKRDLLNITKKQMLIDLESFAEIIAAAMISDELGLEYLINSKKNSSESGRKQVAREVIIAAGKMDENFKQVAADVYLSGIEEDINNEFKETLAFNVKKEEPRDNELFEEAILGTISSFINRGIEGHLYVGVDDSGKTVGIEEELANSFDGSMDKLKRYFQDQLYNKIKTKHYNLSGIKIEEFSEVPLILRINVPKSEDSVAVLKRGNSFEGWFKTDARK